MRVQGVSMHTQFVVRRGPRAGHSFPVYESALTLIGRAPSNHVVLSAPGVSANHCIIAPGPGGQSLNLIDARSKGGLRVNNQPFVKGDLHIGDVVCIGPYELELALAASGPSEPEPARPAADRPSRFEFGRPRNGKRLALPAGSATVIGRGKHAHIQLAHEQVSEYHCILALDPTDDTCTPFLIDLHSANHTFVNRRAVHRKHVMPGDAIILGRVACELRRIEAVTAPRQVRRRVPPPRRKTTSVAARTSSDHSAVSTASSADEPPCTNSSIVSRRQARPNRPPPSVNIPTAVLHTRATSTASAVDTARQITMARIAWTRDSAWNAVGP